MTSNERKVINFLREAVGGAHVRDVAQKTNFSSDYARLLCHSLARAGYITIEDSNICRLLEKGHGHFEDVVAVAEKSEPVTIAVNEEDEHADQLANDEELDKALADLRITPEKDAAEETDGSAEHSPAKTAEGSLGEREEMSNELHTAIEAKEEETKTADVEAELKPEPEEIKEQEPVAEIEIETKASSPEIEEAKQATPQEVDMKTEINPVVPEVPHAMEPVVTVVVESPQELVPEKIGGNATPAIALESSEKADPKEELALPIGGFGAGMKKIANWFAGKK